MYFARKVQCFDKNRAILSDSTGPFWLNITVYWVPDMNGKYSILRKWPPEKYHIFRKLKLKITIIIFFCKICVQSQVYFDFWEITNESGAFMIIKMNKIAEKTTNFLHFEEKNVRDFYFLFVLIF